MAGTTVYRNVHGVQEFFYVDNVKLGAPEPTSREHKNIPALASTVQKTKQWLNELMHEMQWEDSQKTYRGLRAVLHALRDRLTVHETADFASQLPILLRGMFYEGWRPHAVPVKDRSKEAFSTHVSKAFADAPSVDPERRTYAVMIVDKTEEGSQR